MKRVIPFCILLLVFLAAVAFVFWGNRAGEEHLTSVSSAGTLKEFSTQDFSASMAEKDPAVELEREELRLTQGPAESSDQDSTKGQEPQHVFRGRVVAKEDGSPLQGVEVRLHGWPGNSAAVEKYGDPHQDNPAPVFSNSAGRFELFYPVTPAYQMVLTLKHPGRVQLSQRWFDGALNPETYDFEDVMMQVGQRIYGEVRTTDGAILAGFPLQLNGVNQDVKGFRTGYIQDHSDAQGRFELASAVPPGHWTLTGNMRGYLLESPQEIEVPAAGEIGALKVVVKAMPYMAGRIVDKQGVGIKGATVKSRRTTSGYTESAKTDGDGRFQLFARRESLAAVPLQIVAPGFLTIQTETTYAWGSADLTFVLEPTLHFELLVQVEGTEEPVEEYLLNCVVDGIQAPQNVKSQPGGRMIVEGLRSGKGQLLVIPLRADLDTVGAIAVDIVADMETVVVALPKLAMMAVRVVDAQGNPVEGARVYLLSQLPVPAKRDRFVGKYFRPSRSPSSLDDVAVVRNQAQTDSAGRTSIGVPSAARKPAILVRGEFPTLLQEFQPPSPGEELLLTLPALGSIRGILLAPSRLPGSVGLDLFRKGHSPSQARRGAQIAKAEVLIPQADGTFFVENVKPGTYTARLAFAPPATEVALGTSAWWIHSQSMQQFEVRSGEETFLNIDAATRPLGSLKVTAMLEGTAAGGRNISLLGSWDRFSNTFYGQTDSQGELLFEDLPAGKYSGRIQLSDGWVDCPSEAVVVVGERANLLLEGERKEVFLHLVDDQGNNIPAGTMVEIWPFWDQDFLVEAQGLVSLNPAPLLVEQMVLTVGGKSLSTGPVSLAEVASGDTLTVVCK